MSTTNYPAGVIDKDFDGEDEEITKCTNCDEESDDLNKNDVCYDCRRQDDEDEKWNQADIRNDERKLNEHYLKIDQMREKE